MSRTNRNAIATLATVALAAASAAIPAAAAPVLAAAGDIACEPGARPMAAECGQGATAAEIERGRPTAVAALGDEQYEHGALSEFLGPGAFNQTWGAFKPRIRPVPGNHEYSTSNTASGYFEYFGGAAGPGGLGYYSYELGAWHVVALNSSCSDAGCADSEFGSTTSAQLAWLKGDLRRARGHCILAYWHHPLFSSAPTLNDELGVKPLWNLLFSARGDVVLNGHAHVYERFARQTPAGRPSPSGLREFVVGTGGRNHIQVGARLPTSQLENDYAFGVLFLTLRARRYDWQFRDTEGSVLDHGSTKCHYVTARSRRAHRR